MTRQQLERHQDRIYLVAVLAGLILGSAAPGVSGSFEAILWPLLGLLLYTTFMQVPLTHLPDAFRDGRFMGAVLAGNFVLVPLVVWTLLASLPDAPAVRLGVLLVPFVPCTDWYINFTHLGGGDASRAIAVTPVNSLVQLALLSVYLWLFMGDALLEPLSAERVALVFLTLIILPLAAAWLTERWAEGQSQGETLVTQIGWLPVSLLGLVALLISASQIKAVAEALPILGPVLGVSVAFLVAAALIVLALARLVRLPAAAGRALIFSLGTRNSFMVLPLALALAPRWQKATVVIVFQSPVELIGMVPYPWLVPPLLARSASGASGRSIRLWGFLCRPSRPWPGRLVVSSVSAARSLCCGVRLSLWSSRSVSDFDGRAIDRQSVPRGVLVARGQ